MKTRRISTRNPSQAEMARGLNDLHDCLNDTQAKVEEVRSDVRLIKRAFDIPEDGDRPSLPKVKAHWDAKTIATIVAATGGALLLVKAIMAVVVAVAPVAWKALLTVN